MRAGIAKPRPSLPPLPDKINVLIPTTCPFISTSGPPLFPGLIGASVWMYTMPLFGSGWRATELTTPIVIVFCNPSGLPTANTSCPWRTRVLVSKGRDGNSFAVTFNNARSDSVWIPTNFASRIRRFPSGSRVAPSDNGTGNTTRILRAPSTTCALVMTYPLGSTTTPDPMARCRAMSAVSARELSSTGP